jgi:hypothetical protein
MAMTTDTILVGVFGEVEQARNAVQALRQAGFAETDIGIASRTTDTDAIRTADVEEAEGVEAGAITGAVGGAGIGGLWALGIAAGMLPAIGPVIAGGILASILASAAGGAAVGGLVGAFVGMGVSEDDAKHYEQEFRTGKTLLTVNAHDRSTEAQEILLSYGATLRS